ncbi:hypothetical protein OR16_40499 [Cupriavidus basilensis OR16]|uniref:Phosphonate metabolism protein n=1 Tax=Cupriavidus basilensis OR16 TaxID=1127483 RepID=H1SHZ5_9BURK|nr:DUF1045 domain-containing protein [Cupriavidus basilensis]EHP37846.1 hypothetical protein OR16_40499 [Cupriavidus basilensis OR16]
MSNNPLPQAFRYAIYLNPAAPFRLVGEQWLGRSAETGEAIARPAADDARIARWTEAPARYGLHATLKAPFRLAHGQTPAGLDAAMRAFALDRQPFAVPLALHNLRGFLAWCLAGDASADARMHALADAAVRQFDAFRAPPAAAELARRKPGQLGEQERRMLDAWGYPYAFETFIFHITLTGMLDGTEQATAIAMLQAASGPLLQQPLAVRDVSLFVQPAPDAPFVAARHYGFDGTTTDAAGAAMLEATA